MIDQNKMCVQKWFYPILLLLSFYWHTYLLMMRNLFIWFYSGMLSFLVLFVTVTNRILLLTKVNISNYVIEWSGYISVSIISNIWFLLPVETLYISGFSLFGYFLIYMSRFWLIKDEYNQILIYYNNHKKKKKRSHFPLMLFLLEN